MDVDSSSSSPSESLSVVCSAIDYSSNSSDGSSPHSREQQKEDLYWEKRRRSGESSKKREKRRVPMDLSMEQRLLALSQENQLLKSQLESRTASDSLLAPASRLYPLPIPAMPSPSNTPANYEIPAKIQALYGNPNGGVITSRLVPPPTHLPLLQICQLQAAIQQQFQNPPTSTMFSSGSAFQPFHKESVIKSTAERTSPDSSSDNHRPASNQVRTIQHASSSHPPPPPQPPSVLGAILSTRVSPSVPQTSTDKWSRLTSPPRDPGSSSKSDSESHTSSSMSPSGGEEHSAIVQALNAPVDGKRQQYMDRRRRNNEAAKRCRANRRAVFEYRSRRVQILEGENESLKEEIANLKRDIDHFKTLLSHTQPVALPPSN